MRHLALLASTLLVTACASAEGPGSLESIGQPQVQPVAQPVSAPQPVAAQALPAPGTAAAATAPPATVYAQPDQRSSDPLVADLSTPGQVSRAPDLTLQDFSTIEPAVVPGSDPFEAQRAASAASSSIDDPQQSLEDAVAGGLRPDANQAALLQPVLPQFPRTALAPISTAPEPQATQLFDALDDALFDGGLELAFHGDDTARYVIRSQVSAIPEATVTTVLYAFDIYDARGTLRHRVTGTRAIGRTSADGWGMVDTTASQQIAAEVAPQLLRWLRANPA